MSVHQDRYGLPLSTASAEAASAYRDGVDLMLATYTPETVNPVSDACEAAGVPCISTVVPWEAWYFGRGAKPDQTTPAFKYTYHFFWGLEDVIAVFTNMWGQVPTNKSVGGLFPNDGDGNAWGDKERGFPPVLGKLGYKLTDPGRFQNLNDTANDGYYWQVLFPGLAITSICVAVAMLADSLQQVFDR